MAILDICEVGVSPITEIVFSDRNLIKKRKPMGDNQRQWERERG